MLRSRPRATILPWFRIFASTLLTVLSLPAAAATSSDSEVRELPTSRALIQKAGAGAGVFGTANSSCPTCDTVWVGHSNAGPGGAFLGVGIGGRWDFDGGVAGTDTTQGWQRRLLRFHFGAARAVTARPEWHIDYGNAVNEGNTNLWNARNLAGRKYVKTGIAGVWHSDDMTNVKLNVANGAEPTSLPIAGSRSAWCGLRESGNQQAVDALTGNYINGDLLTDLGQPYAVSNEPEFPGYCNQWDQMMYKDFTSAGSGTIAARVRVALSSFLDTAVNGSGWFDPDPTSIANYVHLPADSFLVYVGSPNESAYDTNRRWFSEVLDLTQPHQELYRTTNVVPLGGVGDTTLSLAYAGINPVGGKVRVVFRVKTNRVRSDMSTGTLTGFNTKDGAAVIDQVQVNGGTTYGFETAGSVTARSLIGDIGADGGAWATTGKPPGVYFHVGNLSTLLYEDLCGAVGAPTRICDMVGNVAVGGDADNANSIPIETWQIFESPTIDLAVRNAAPGTKNGQGIDQQTAARLSAVTQFDFYSGFMSLDESVFYFTGARGWAPAIFKQPISQRPIWSTCQLPPFISNNTDPTCYNQVDGWVGFGFPVGVVDSARVILNVQTAGYRFGGTNLGNTRGTYYDNIRVGLIAGEAPILSWDIWQKLQDSFPFNEGVTPGDNASFDTTTALMRTGLNIVNPTADPGVVAGDSIVVQAPYTGNGTSTGTRVDLVFRIDPGPGNYVTKGNRGSALVNKDAAHPFFATYLANNGPFGTPGGHGGVWKKDVWNSARMDSAEGTGNIYPVVSRGIGLVLPPQWQGTLHESDPNFNTLGIVKNVCFLVDPNGAVDETNIDCSGVVPAPYGAVSGTTKEHTKILPDGWFTPGTHIEYFARRSAIEAPSAGSLYPDTTTVWPQDPAGSLLLDAERFFNVDVLPDMWKSTRYLGGGLACMLMVDDNDRRGADPQYRGAADTLGFGKNNGATAGWKGLGPRPTTQDQTNDPAGFVSANLGQYGLNYDHYDITGAEGAEGGHLGVRLAQNLARIAEKGDKSGPSSAQLNTFYNNVLWVAGDLDDNSGTLHDGIDASEGADDITLLTSFLDASSPANRKSLWLSGDGIMQDGFNGANSALFDFLSNTFGSDLTAPNYKATTSDTRTTIGFLPTASWAHPGRVYGFNHACTIKADVLAVVPTVDGATEGAQYQNIGPGPYTASVYRPVNAGVREYRTLIDGFDMSNLLGNYASLGQVATLPGTDLARISWFDDAYTSFFQLCARKGPVVGVGDVPGPGGQRFTNQVLGTYPNPAFANQRVTMRFTLAKAQNVTVRIYSVAGREVASFAHRGTEGPNNVIWDGALSNGAKATPGVYFYRIDGADFGKSASAQKMILLSSN